MIAEHLTDLTALLKKFEERDGTAGEEEFAEGLGPKPRDLYIPDRDIRGDIPVRPRDFRYEGGREHI